MIVRFKLLSSTAQAPSYMRPGDASADLFADEDAVVYPGDRRTVKTNVTVELPPGHVGLVCPRSGLAQQHGVTVLNAPGVIDSNYRGGVEVLLVNHGARQHAVRRGDRIAQLLIWPSYRVDFVEMASLNESPPGGLDSPDDAR